MLNWSGHWAVSLPANGDAGYLMKSSNLYSIPFMDGMESEAKIWPAPKVSKQMVNASRNEHFFCSSDRIPNREVSPTRFLSWIIIGIISIHEQRTRPKARNFIVCARREMKKRGTGHTHTKWWRKHLSLLRCSRVLVSVHGVYCIAASFHNNIWLSFWWKTMCTWPAD